MSERDTLLTRKRDIFAALHVLEGDLRDGTIDPETYHVARRRYELEAADLLRRLDGLEEHRAMSASVPASLTRSPLLVAGLVAVVTAAAVVFLLTSTHQRGSAGTATGDANAAVSVTPTATAKLRRAEEAALTHPRSYSALLDLASAFVQSGDSRSADEVYLRAMALNPRKPEAGTLHAMILSSAGQDAPALALLRTIERSHPSFSRAFLLEGIVAAHTASGYPRALKAWKRFLAIDPKSSPAPRVRQWIASIEKAQRSSQHPAG